MIAVINKILDWFKSLFWKEGESRRAVKNSSKNFPYRQLKNIPSTKFFPPIIFSIHRTTEMELTLVGLQYSGEIAEYDVVALQHSNKFNLSIAGKTTFVNVIAVSRK